MAVQEKLYTAEELWALSQLPENDGKHMELIEGVIDEMAPAGEQHGDVTMEIGRLIANYVKEHRLGRVTAAETGYLLHRDPDGKETLLAPDVGFIARERAAKPPAKSFVDGAPDLAVEVISPSETYTKIAQKVALYLKHGTRMVWVVDPGSQTVVVHTPDDSRRYAAESVLEGGEVLPGFKLAVKALFAEE